MKLAPSDRISVRENSVSEIQILSFEIFRSNDFAQFIRDSYD